MRPLCGWPAAGGVSAWTLLLGRLLRSSKGQPVGMGRSLILREVFANWPQLPVGGRFAGPPLISLLICFADLPLLEVLL